MNCEAEGKILVALPTTNGQTKTGKDWQRKSCFGNYRTFPSQNEILHDQFRWSCRRCSISR